MPAARAYLHFLMLYLQSGEPPNAQEDTPVIIPPGPLSLWEKTCF